RQRRAGVRGAVDRAGRRGRRRRRRGGGRAPGGGRRRRRGVPGPGGEGGPRAGALRQGRAQPGCERDARRPRRQGPHLRGRRPMIIDCHGHYTTVPAAQQEFRNAQLAALDDPSLPAPAPAKISDDEIRESVEGNQLRILRERGGDLMLFSPRASSMAHHVPDPATARAWAATSNDLVARVVDLYPDHFAPVCQLPQTPGGSLDDSVAELRRCVGAGFVGCNLNPDPSGGYWTSPPLTDEYWFPLYEAMVELDVPAMVHVSASCNPNFHALGAHYLNADTSTFMQFLE